MFSTGDIIGLILVYGYVSLVVTVSTWARKRDPECNYRKIVHVLIGNIVFLWWVFDDRWIMGLLAAFPFVPLLLLLTPKAPLKKLKGSFLEMASAQGHSYGLVYYAVTWTILAIALFDHRMVAGIAIAAMSFGDGVGGLVGKRYGKKKLYGSKTYIGTSAVFLGAALSALAVILFYTYLGGYMPLLGVPSLDPLSAVGAAVLVGAFVAVVELFSPGEYDNLIVPLSTAALLLLVGM